MLKLGEIPLLKELYSATGDTSVDPSVSATAVQKRRIHVVARLKKTRPEGTQELGFSSRPFSLCGLPYDKPEDGQLEYTRRNGKYILRVIGDSKYGLPWGMDQSIPFWVATKIKKRFGGRSIESATITDRLLIFNNVNELLSDLGMARNGWSYRKVEGMFQRTFGATITWGSERDHGDQYTWAGVRFGFFDAIQFTGMKQDGDIYQEMFPELKEDNVLLVSEAFFREVIASSLPFDMEVFRTLRNSPGLLHFFMSLSHRCHNARGKQAIPLFGPEGLRSQLGVSEKMENKLFKLQIKRWLEKIRVYWPECPAYVYEDKLIVAQSSFCTPRQVTAG
jgi:Replication initiator protein A